MLARVSKLIGPRGLVASHSRSQPRFSISSRSRDRTSRRRMGRTVIRPSRRVGMTATSVADGRDELTQPGTELGTEVLALARELQDRLDVVHLVAGVVAAAAEDDSVDSAVLFGGGEVLQGVCEL